VEGITQHKTEGLCTAAAMHHDEPESATPGGRGFFLSPNVHFCADPSGPVLLDAGRGRYYSFTRWQSAALARHVVGWPDYPEVPGRGTSEDELLESLLSQGLLTREMRIGKPVRQVDIPRAQRVLVAPDLDGPPPAVGLGDLSGFARAMLAARWALKRHPFLSIIQKAAARKRRAEECVPDLAAARQSVSKFHYLRPLLFNGRDQCLLSCLALLEGLAPLAIFPTWVFGVRLKPVFKGHCWIQHEDTVWIGGPDDLEGFTAILAV
jgi:hypothetical protein